MLTIIKSNWERMLQRRLQCLVTIILTIGAIVVAIVFSHQGPMKGNLAVVGQYGQSLELPYYKMTYLDTIPSMSELVQKRYEAIIIFTSEDEYEIRSIKSEEEKVTLNRLIENPLALENEDEPKQIGTSILGYMMMFLLMQGMNYARLFAEEKDKHLSERILVSSVSPSTYLIGHGIFTGLFVFIPPFCMIVILKLLSVDIGFSIIAYMLLISMLAFLSTSVAFCLYSLMKGADRANMIGSALVILTSLLTGCFSSYADVEQGMSKALYLLPQKSLLFFAQGVENRSLNVQVILSATYVILFSITLMMISILKIKKDYRYKRYSR